MKITYLSCDGISVAIEEITKVEFCNSDRGVELECIRSPKNKDFDKTAKGRFANMFTVSVDKVYSFIEEG